MSLRPLGIFWDIENCGIPKNMRPNDFVTQLRSFIINKYFDNCIEYRFCCACNSKLLDDSITKSLNLNGVDIVDVNSMSKIDADQKLRENMEKFVDHYGFDSIVVIITGDIDFSPSIRSARRKEVTVLLIYNNNASNQLIASPNDSVSFDEVFGLNDCVILSLSNLPETQSRKVIRDSFMPFCQSFNCKFRAQKKGFAKLVFNNLIDAKRAEEELNKYEFFGHELVIELEEMVANNCSTNSSKLSLIGPQNDDNCKSVIIGLFSKKNENVLQKVRQLVKNWNEEDISEDMIYRVNRERDFAERDGKATLIVTAIDSESNNKLLAVAKTRFVDREKRIYWNRLRRSKRDLNINGSSVKELTNDFNNISINKELSLNNNEISDEFKSVIIGLYTRHDENVLKLIRNLVQSWNVFDFDVNHIVCVDRAKKFYRKDGKAPLIVSTDSVENNRKLLKYAIKKFINRRNRMYWKALEVKPLNESKPQVKQFIEFKNKDLITKPVNYIPIAKDMTQSYAQITANSHESTIEAQNLITEFVGEQNPIPELNRLSFSAPKRRDNCICQ